MHLRFCGKYWCGITTNLIEMLIYDLVSSHADSHKPCLAFNEIDIFLKKKFKSRFHGSYLATLLAVCKRLTSDITCSIVTITPFSLSPDIHIHVWTMLIMVVFRLGR